MQLHMFEQTILQQNQTFLFLMCFYLTVAVVSNAGMHQHRLFFAHCKYDSDNYEYFANVLNRAVVPQNPQCRFYADGLNLTNATNVTGVNASALHVVSNLTTVLQQCTLSLHSLWR